MAQTDSEDTRQGLGQAMVALRATFEMADGSADLGGKTYAYKQALRDAREKANAKGEEWDKVFHAARHHTQRAMRAHLRELARGNEARYEELCHEYHIKPADANTRRNAQLAAQRAMVSERGVGARSVIALLESVRDRVRATVDADDCGSPLLPAGMTSEEAQRLQVIAAELCELLPRAVSVWRRHAPK
ncbi:MAG: hypothetical protein ABIQ18_06865 [Umezawaea sp.]